VPPISGTALESLAKEHIAVEAMLVRLSNRYDEPVLRAISDLPNVDAAISENLDALQAWTETLSAALPSANGDRASNNQGGRYTAELERGNSDGEGVRIAIQKTQHGITTTRYLPREFFDTNEYRHIMSLAGKIRDLIGKGAFIERGDKRADVTTFAGVIDWLMAEARKGQTIQRYKGLGEMNPEQLWDTTVTPETRRLMQVRIEDAVKTDEIFPTLMGDQVEPRREFIEKYALTVENLDF